MCSKFASAQFNLIMSDTSTRHFCSYECVASFRVRQRETPSVLLKKDKQDPVPITFGKFVRTKNLNWISFVLKSMFFPELSTASQNPNYTAAKTVFLSAPPTSEVIIEIMFSVLVIKTVTSFSMMPKIFYWPFVPSMMILQHLKSYHALSAECHIQTMFFWRSECGMISTSNSEKGLHSFDCGLD